MSHLQRDAESVLERTGKRTIQLLSRDQERAIDRVLAQARQLRTDLEKRARRVTRNVETQAERFVATLERQAAAQIRTLLKRLDLPTRRELDDLSRRIGQMERRLRSRRPIVPAPQPKASAKALAAPRGR